jgi:two-component system chemotaxis response regulator CheY
MRAFVVTALEGAGIGEVTSVDGGLAALMALRPAGAGVDLLITDVNMPDLNGLELIRFVRGHAALARLPLLVISTDGRERDRERCLALGADAFLPKPFSPEELVAAVRRLCPESPR